MLILILLYCYYYVTLNKLKVIRLLYVNNITSVTHWKERIAREAYNTSRLGRLSVL